MKYNQLLSINADTKTIKGLKDGYLTGILYLAPGKISGRNLCPNASPGCLSSCLYKAGRGAFNSIQKARIKKTRYFLNNKNEFMLNLVNSIQKLIKKANKENLKPVVRLNGTSDIPWENITIVKDGVIHGNIFTMFPELQFYDYTKSNKRNVIDIDNYHLTFSKSETNDNVIPDVIKQGLNVAVVFDKLPKKYLGLNVFNGDKSDLRFLDPDKSIIGLIAKGPAKKDNSGFVVHTNN
tara:strand:- start:382 stop:1092 length:711 start_codon:yes stop_codon:yes gene_type:complete